MSFIPKPPFPNVPNLPGVPQMRRSPQFPASPPPVLGGVIALGRIFQALFAGPTWGIYRHQTPQQDSDGVLTITVTGTRSPVVQPDTILDFGYQNEFSMLDYPVEDGGFMQANKVANPFEIRLRLAKGGTKQGRKQFLDSIDAIAGDLNLYDIITPEKTYSSVNVLRVENQRTGVQGAYYIGELDIIVREIRTVTSVYSTTDTLTTNAKQPSARPTANVGTVAPEPTNLTPATAGIEAKTP